MKMIVAYDRNGAIGKDNTIPWHLPEDFKHFRETTMDSILIMGRKTYESLPVSSLPGRHICVLTKKPAIKCNKALAQMIRDREADDYKISVHQTLGDCIDFAKSHPDHKDKDVFVAGGAEIYSMCIKNYIATEVIASEIDDTIVGADTFFPKEELRTWNREVLKEYDGFKVVRYTR